MRVCNLLILRELRIRELENLGLEMKKAPIKGARDTYFRLKESITRSLNFVNGDSSSAKDVSALSPVYRRNRPVE